MKFTYNKYSIHFRDSYQILNSSFRKLCKSFNIINQKGIFPYKFANLNNLNYNGHIPDISYFDKLKIYDYNNYKKDFNNNWNFKDEAIKYCELDCISLYQILNIFNDLMFNEFKINMNKYPTIPSIRFCFI